MCQGWIPGQMHLAGVLVCSEKETTDVSQHFGRCQKRSSLDLWLVPSAISYHSPSPGLPELLPAGPALPSAFPRSIPGCIQCAPGPCHAAPKATAAPEPKGCRRPECPASSTVLTRAGSSSQALIAHTRTHTSPSQLLASEAQQNLLKIILSKLGRASHGTPL